MDLPGLFSHYGYLMLLVGSLGEGMPIMLFGGFAAHRGWLALVPWVILIGAIGNAVAQGVWFYSARYAGRRILQKRTDWAVKVERADRLLDKWEAPVIVGARFIPGFSSTATIAVALSNVSSSIIPASVNAAPGRGRALGHAPIRVSSGFTALMARRERRACAARLNR